MARLGVPVGGRVRKRRAVGDQSAPIPEEVTSELGRIIYSLAHGRGRTKHEAVPRERNKRDWKRYLNYNTSSSPSRQMYDVLSQDLALLHEKE